MIVTVVEPPNWLVIVTLVPLPFTLILKLYVVPLLVIGVLDIGLGPATAMDSFALGLLDEALAVTVITPLEELCDALRMVMVSLGTIDVDAGGAADVAVIKVVGGTLDVGAGAVLGGHDEVAGGDPPGQGLNCPTMTSVAGGEFPTVPGMYGPDPFAR